ncbi:type IV secretion system protein VirB3 [Xylella fastidiosa]|uniref:Conjugal transfer protein n=1 Tax=Xylella fastidiosa (strain 9a5c) TaxID=160492 RepID=Q9PHJ9_XYLFA|nr:type IV secretion system protein VirB3 [Xylella fastidiosa]AAF85575.1 conjugal transfer protein [Xylella fastidiosa 9a5c]ALQ95989.1 conjugal transfer protein [Xylella fastidiosa]ALR03229.1 conjugal transfer protein [Xylella fastidiosa]KXB10322.1 conjugal transfer protein [Xylella fastidiosa]KXB18628.1 conjugal transfer protein [Xylella fastidiosa]
MSNSTQDVYTDPLFVGLTRPASILGIPYEACVAEFMAMGLIFLSVNNPLYLALALPMHAVLYLISANDPKIFSSIHMWLKTNGRCRNFLFWRASSFSPLATKKLEKVRLLTRIVKYFRVREN